MGVWNTATPAGTDLISAGDDNIRELKAALEEALSEEAVFPGSAPLTAPIFKWTGKRGNTAGRPGSPDTGELYFNTQIFQLEYYDGATWTGYDLVPLLAITTAKINDLAITAGKIATDAVETAKIKDLNVTTGKINDLAITTGKVADSAITNVKIDTLAVTKLTGILAAANGGNAVAHKVVTCTPYTGDGLDNRNIAHGLGTTPDAMLIVGQSSGSPWSFRGSNFNAGESKSSSGTGEASGIKSADATNVTIGTSATVNTNAIPYVLICIKTT
jgi:hypothetical protein